MRTLPVVFAILTALGYAPLTLSQPAQTDPDLVEMGAKIATAADCVSCHRADFSGGQSISSPIGDIYAKNITPDKETGIGNWSLDDFSDAVRHGKSPNGYLYPAMPYTSYTAMSDSDLRALYSYLMLKVEPVSTDTPTTDLPFPFFRQAMPVWNALFLKPGVAPGGPHVDDDQLIRGRYLVEALGHCSACHTPRGALMQEKSSEHMAGALNNGWWAPNISSSDDGIAAWSDKELTDFLTSGHNRYAAAGGEMGKVVANSLSKLDTADMDAVVAYLRELEPQESAKPQRLTQAPAVVSMTEQEPQHDSWKARINADTTNGATLYQSACASCHGANGKGTQDGAFISLHDSSTVTSPYSANLVQSIAHGIDLTLASGLLMPAFQDELSDKQVAAVANYVRTSFGSTQSELDAADVTTILDADVMETPWLIQNAAWLLVACVLIALIILIAIVVAIMRRRSRRR